MLIRSDSHSFELEASLSSALLLRHFWLRCFKHEILLHVLEPQMRGSKLFDYWVEGDDITLRLLDRELLLSKVPSKKPDIEPLAI